jgi:hypothetical protein
MLRIPFRNLAIAVCLVVQAMATPSISCPCRAGNEEDVRPEHVAASSKEAANRPTTHCSACEARAKVRQPQESRATDRPIRPSAVATPIPRPLDDDTIAWRVALLGREVLPTPDVHELQVLLE